MEVINTASQFNMTGVGKLLSGDLAGAYGCFRQGLVLLATFAGSNVVVDVTTLGNQTTTAESSSEVGRDWITRAGGYSNPGAADSKEAYFVWREPLLFHYDPQDPLISNQRLALFAATLEFNLALVYHVRSLQDGEASGYAKATRAASLYNTCLLHVEIAMGNYRNTDIVDVANNILIAASNNRAMILRQWVDPTDSNEEVQQLLKDGVVACNSMPMDDKPDIVIFDTNEIQEFMLNLQVYGAIIIAPVA